MKKILAVAAVLGVLLSANAFAIEPACGKYVGIYKINEAGEKVIVGVKRVEKECTFYNYPNTPLPGMEGNKTTSANQSYTDLGTDINGNRRLKNDSTGELITVHK
ncbi:MAG: hypothetical protein MR428_01750 [Mesosutterella sp.]|nr:hypothetical protein [Mesosutterella sp.]